MAKRKRKQSKRQPRRNPKPRPTPPSLPDAVVISGKIIGLNHREKAIRRRLTTIMGESVRLEGELSLIQTQRLELLRSHDSAARPS